MMEIDARGKGCPTPVLMAEEALSGVSEGTAVILVDNEASVKNLSKFASKNALHFESKTEDGYWRVSLVKGYKCEYESATGPASAMPAEGGKPRRALIVGTDTLGKDEALGHTLMKALFETMRVNREVPEAIFFLNAGVRLTTTEEEIVALLRQLEAMGTEIYSCGTCLMHYGLEKELKVGMRGTSDKLLELMLDYDNTTSI